MINSSPTNRQSLSTTIDTLYRVSYFLSNGELTEVRDIDQNQEMRAAKRRLEKVLVDNGFRRSKPNKAAANKIESPEGYRFTGDRIVFVPREPNDNESAVLEAERMYKVLSQNGFRDCIQHMGKYILITPQYQD